MYKKFGNITIEYDSLRRLLDVRHNILPKKATEAIDGPITMEELKRAVQKGKPNKAPGWDGISQDFQNHVGRNQIRASCRCKRNVDRWPDFKQSKTWNDRLCPKETSTNESRRLPTPDIAVRRL
jgi:hypothetical protein